MTTKKKFLFTLALALLPLSSVCVSALAHQVFLQVRIEDPKDPQDNNHRGPVIIPEVNIEYHTMYFTSLCYGSILHLVDENGQVVYSIVIPDDADELDLPSTLSGNYEIQIIQGNLCFYGDITL